MWMQMKYYAICIACGKQKQTATIKCPNCNFAPEAVSDKAKSYLLSTDFEMQSNELGNVQVGKSRDQLRVIGDAIARGEAAVFSPDDLAAAERQVEYLNSLTAKKVLGQ